MLVEFFRQKMGKHSLLASKPMLSNKVHMTACFINTCSAAFDRGLRPPLGAEILTIRIIWVQDLYPKVRRQIEPFYNARYSVRC